MAANTDLRKIIFILTSIDISYEFSVPSIFTIWTMGWGSESYTAFEKSTNYISNIVYHA